MDTATVCLYFDWQSLWLPSVCLRKCEVQPWDNRHHLMLIKCYQMNVKRLLGPSCCLFCGSPGRRRHRCQDMCIWYPEQWRQNKRTHGGASITVLVHSTRLLHRKRPRIYGKTPTPSTKSRQKTSRREEAAGAALSATGDAWKIPQAMEAEGNASAMQFFPFVVTQLPLTAKCPTDSRRPQQPSIYPLSHFPLPTFPTCRLQSCGKSTTTTSTLRIEPDAVREESKIALGATKFLLASI